MKSSNNKMEIDEGLYSRQIAVYGKKAMKTLTSAKVCIVNFDSSALELIKNLVLAGVSELYLSSYVYRK